MRKWITAVILGSLFLAGCGDHRGYEQINTQTHIDAARTNDKIIVDILRNSNTIMSMVMNMDGNAFTKSKLEGLLDQEIDRTQQAINELVSHLAPDALNDEKKQTFEALVNYKSALFFLRDTIRSGQDSEQEMKQFIDAVNYLQSSFYVKP